VLAACWRGMEPRELTITLDLRIDEHGLSGRAADGSGPARDFSGRLGLLTAIEQLIAARRTPSVPTTPVT
jgi:hypothetical protein